MAITNQTHYITDYAHRKQRSGRRKHLQSNCKSSLVIIMRKRLQKVYSAMGTWNVRSMFEAGKVYFIVKEIDRLQISVMGITEMR